MQSQDMHVEDPQMLCAHGDGQFEAHFDSGVTVSVSAVRNGGFAEHACTAAVTYKDRVVVVTPAAAQVDIDVLGADLGFGVPVVAFQVRKADRDRTASYRIYSLDKRPRLLRTITGGDIYRASDIDLDGRVAIWTGDVAGYEGVGGLDESEFDFPPIVALRFERNRLVDVSGEYALDYDRRIAQLRASLDPRVLGELRAGDVRLVDASLPPHQLAQLRRTQARILEIVWLYLYSGREQQAWTELAAAWPRADIARVQAAIVADRKAGIDSQADRIESAPKHPREMPHTQIYNTEQVVSGFHFQERQAYLADVVDMPPRQILILRKTWPPQQEILDLVIDAAGKVWSAQTESQDPELLQATEVWKFVPAFKDGRPVACRYRIAVSPYQ